MSIQERLILAVRNQASYRPNDEVARHLKQIIFGALIGTTSVGKSHLIPFVIKDGGAKFSEVGNISSREKRPTDPQSFRASQPIEELLDRIERRELVNYMIHPSGNIYGTDIKSYTTEYVLLPTLTSALEQLQDMDCFKRIIPIGIVTDGASWESRLGDRKNDSTIAIRMQEALDCTTWLENHSSQIPILENKTGEETSVAHQIVEIMLDPTHPHPLENRQQIDHLLPQLTVIAKKHLEKHTTRV